MHTAHMPLVLLIEDDVGLSQLISQYLQSNRFRVIVADVEQLSIDELLRDVPNIILLDLGLPHQDGLEVCRQLRTRYQNPILILTARDNSLDHVLGLELGADDYVIKPVEPRVLMARINALLRRSQAAVVTEQTVWRFGQLTINVAARAVMLNGQEISLSSGEFDLLVHLAINAGKVQSRDQLFRQLFNREYDGADRLLDIRVSHLRKKLGEHMHNSERIKTIWGQGYLFVADAW